MLSSWYCQNCERMADSESVNSRFPAKYTAAVPQPAD
jgi:C4-type Zn-finger protein